MGQMKIFFYCLICIISIIDVSAQIEENFYYKDENREVAKTDSLFRNLNSNLPDSYYIITYPIGEKITSFGMQLYKSYHSVRDEGKKIVLLLSNKGGIRRSDINLLLKKLLKVDDQELQNITIIWDEEIYQYIVKDRRLVRLLYIYRNNVFYNENQKLHSFAKFKTPEPIIEIKETKSIKILENNKYIIKGSDDIFAFKEGHVFILGDIMNTLYDVDINTGTIQPFFEINNYFNPFELFSKEIAGNNINKYNIAKEHDARLVEGNRQTIQLNQVVYQNDRLFGTFSIEVTEINDKRDSYISDEGEVIYHKIGATILNHYLFFFCWDPSSKQIVWVSEIKNPLPSEVYTNVDCGFYIKDDVIYTGVTRYPAPERELGHIGEYEIINGKTAFKKFTGPFTQQDKLFSNYNFKDHFYEFNNSLMYSYTCLGDIGEVGKDKVISKFYGDGTRPYSTQKFKEFNEDTVDIKLNFMIGAVQSIFSDEYIFAFYKYKEKYIFELKDLLFNTTDIIDAASIKGMESYINQGFRHSYPNGIIIYNNNVHCLILENNDLILKTFSISKY